MELVADGQELKYVQGKNKDLREVTLRAKSAGDGQEGPVLLKFAQAYGFRNIQNIMRRIKQGKCDYDYVELMACPSGCTNGGGQIKVSQLDKDRVGNVVENQELVKAVNEILHFEQDADAQKSPSSLQQREEFHFQLLKEMSQLEACLIPDQDDGEVDSNSNQETKAWYQTRFKAIPKDNVSALNLRW